MSRGPTCIACEPIAAPAVDVLSILRRLPESLFNLETPSGERVPELLAGDVAYDPTIFGPMFPGEPTPQYEIARVLAEEKSRWLYSWRRSEANQLGLGVLQNTDAGVVSQCPHASGVDLDRVGSQFGIGRPTGFTDCCYWRLIQVLLFTAGPTAWKLLEIAQIYTGLRPRYLESLAYVGLSWPLAPLDDAFFSPTDAAPAGGDGFFDSTASYAGTASAALVSDGHVSDSGAALGDGDAFWSSMDPFVTGLTLEQALAIAKPAGVFVELISRPLEGASGCWGATTEVPDNTGSGWFSVAEES